MNTRTNTGGITQPSIDRSTRAKDGGRRSRLGHGPARALLAAMAAALIAAGCTSTSAGGTREASGGRPERGGQARATRQANGSGRPIARARVAVGGSRPERVVVIVEENHSIDQIIGSPAAPFINRLARNGALLTGYTANTHPSLPNYIAMLSGDTHGITTNCSHCTVDAPSLVDQLDRAGISWKAYMQGLPGTCSTAYRAGAYVKSHNPFLYFRGIQDDPARCRKVVSFQRLNADIASGRLPRFVFISPDVAHDMHGTGRGGNGRLVATGDRQLRDLLTRLASSPAWRQDTRVVVTWDEGRLGVRTRGPCCGTRNTGGHIATIVAGPRVRPARDATPYNHDALLRSIETVFGLPYLGHAGDPSTRVIPALTG